MKIRRAISVYSIDDDKLINEIDIEGIQVASIREILTPNEEDPNFYMVYKLNKEQFMNFLSLFPSLSIVAFDSNVEVYLEAYQDNAW